MFSQLQMQQVTESERLRKEAVLRRWSAYYGDLPPMLKVQPGKPDDNILLNFARLIVDKGVSFLFGANVEFNLDDADGNTQTPADEWLQNCWRANRKMTTLHRLGTTGAIVGQHFQLEQVVAGRRRNVIVIPVRRHGLIDLAP